MLLCSPNPGFGMQTRLMYSHVNMSQLVSGPMKQQRFSDSLHVKTVLMAVAGGRPAQQLQAA
jgi:hypothetical protein